MTAPIGLSDEGVAIAEMYSWVRHNPADMKHPPSTFAKLLDSEEWRQRFHDWLNGSTGGTPNATRFPPHPAEPVKAMFDKLTHSRKTPGHDVYVTMFEAQYAKFLRDVKGVQLMLDDRARALSTDPQRPMSAKRARQAAGKEVTRAAYAGAVLQQLGDLDVEIALVARVQVEQYKSTVFETTMKAVAVLRETPWDEFVDDDGAVTSRGYKEEALELLTQSMGPVMTACAAVQTVAGKLQAVGDPRTPGPVRAELQGQVALLTEELFGTFADLGEAIGEQGKAMTAAVKRVRDWAEYATEQTMREGWATIHPKIAGAFTLLKVATEIGCAVAVAVPGLHAMVLPLAGLTLDVLELTVSEIGVHAAKKDVANQARYATKKWVRAQDLSTPAKINAAVKEGLDYYDKAVNLPIKLVAEGAGAAAGAAAGLAGVRKRHRLETAERVEQLAAFAGKTQEYKTEFPSTIEGAVTKLVEIGGEHGSTLLAEVTPVLGIAVHGKNAAQLLVNYADAQHQVLRRQANLSEADEQRALELIRSRDRMVNPYHTMFSSGAMTVRPDGRVLWVTVPGAELKVDLDAGVVTPADPALLERRFLGLMRSKIGPTVPYKGNTYTLDWSQAKDLPVTDPTCRYVQVVGTTVVAGTTYTVEADIKLEYENEQVDVMTIRCPVPVPENEIAGRLEQGLTTNTPAVIDEALIAKQFAGAKVHFNGRDHVLTGDVIVDPDSRPDRGWIHFLMKSTAPEHLLDLTYDVDDGLRVLAVDATDAAPVNPKLGKVVDTSTVGKKIRSYRDTAPGRQPPLGPVTMDDLVNLLRSLGHAEIVEQGVTYTLVESSVRNWVTDATLGTIDFQADYRPGGHATFAYELDRPLRRVFQTPAQAAAVGAAVQQAQQQQQVQNIANGAQHPVNMPAGQAGPPPAPQAGAQQGGQQP